MSHHDAKRKALLAARALNPHPEFVTAKVFSGSVFFDPDDRAQVKYEMLRRREVDGAPLGETCREFGFTREGYRQILARFHDDGLAGLFDRKRGRKGPLKVTSEVVEFILEAGARRSITAEQIASKCKKRLGVEVSARTVSRVLADKPRRLESRGGLGRARAGS